MKSGEKKRQPRDGINWSALPFAYSDHWNSYIRYTFKDGEWNQGTLCRDPMISIHMACTGLHYGQAAFEGLKAFRGKDGRIRIFRPDQNASRLARSAKRTVMAEVPAELFLEAVHKVVEDNAEWVPPHGTGSAMYIRPLLFGSGPRMGVQPADEYTFLVMVMPVGPYYKEGIKPTTAMIMEDFDRAAPLGTGCVKLAGNYGAAMEPTKVAKEKGVNICLYLDSKEHKFIDEFGTSNFIAITKEGVYVTPKSSSILPSITNLSLMDLQRLAGRKVEQRPIHINEITGFAEAGATGTAVVITPVCKFLYGDRVLEVGPKDRCPPIFLELYQKLQAIQFGDAEAPEGWIHFVD